MNTTNIETVESVRSRQVIWVDWMQKATEGLSDDSLVEVTTQHTPFGDYCLGIKKVNFSDNQEQRNIWLAGAIALNEEKQD